MANTPDLAVHISELETVHEVSPGEIDAILRPTVLFSHTNKLKILDLADADTDPTKNLQDNGTMLPVETHPSLPHSPLEDTLVALEEPPAYPRVGDGYAALQACMGDLTDVLLLGADNMLFGGYQDWVHQNSGDHLDSGITEYGKCQYRWKNSSICQTNATVHRPVKLGEDLLESFLWISMGYSLGSGTMRR